MVIVIVLPAKDTSSAAAAGGLAPATAKAARPAVQMATEMSDPSMASLRLIIPSYHYAQRTESEEWHQYNLCFIFCASISPLSEIYYSQRSSANWVMWFW